MQPEKPVSISALNSAGCCWIIPEMPFLTAGNPDLSKNPVAVGID